MARLKAIPSRLGKAPPRLVAPASDPSLSRTMQRREDTPWRAWYSTARWQRLRWSVLVRDLFTCAYCARIEAQTRLLVADHKKAHRGNPDLFWDKTNLQCLCKACHDSTKQREERRF
jgi:5-methylcytosine-specific restriction enzyme A